VARRLGWAQMTRIARYTLGVGGGAFLLALVGGQALPQAAQLAGIAISIGWAIWGALALSGELGTVAGGVGRFAFDAVGAMFSRSDGDAENDELNIAKNETLAPAPATRFIRVNDKNGSRWLAVDDGPRGDYRRQVVSFLILGARVGFTFRAMKNRALPGQVRVDYSLWSALSDDLCAAGMLAKDRRNGTRLALTLGDALERVASGAPLPGDVIVGEIV
jgi:hypothetical protein